jgi:hypothetical protein
MSTQRTFLVAFATLFIAGSSAFAQCGNCGFAAPAYVQPAPAYAQPAPFYAAPAQVYAPGGCGRCGASIAPEPVPPPVPVAPAPIAVDHWDTGGYVGGCGLGGLFGGGFGNCGGCGGLGGCGGNCCSRSAGYAPAPLYVVNQGPQYSGPGMMVPYQTYAPAAAYAPAVNYPYIAPRYPFYARRHWHRRLAFHARGVVHPHRFYGPRPRWVHPN